jgi:hypothetical protein
VDFTNFVRSKRWKREMRSSAAVRSGPDGKGTEGCGGGKLLALEQSYALLEDEVNVPRANGRIQTQSVSDQFRT